MKSSPGNIQKKDLVNRWVLNDEQKVDNDLAEVTSSGRSFHVRGPTTGTARLVGDVCQLDQRHFQMVDAYWQQVQRNLNKKVRTAAQATPGNNLSGLNIFTHLVTNIKFSSSNEQNSSNWVGSVTHFKM